MLLIDGHNSHCTGSDVLHLDQENDIIKVHLPPHSFHLLHLLHHCIYRPLKHFLYKVMHFCTQPHPYCKSGTIIFPTIAGELAESCCAVHCHFAFEVCNINHTIQRRYQRSNVSTDAVLAASAVGVDQVC